MSACAPAAEEFQFLEMDIEGTFKNCDMGDSGFGLPGGVTLDGYGFNLQGTNI